ncbi:MAG: ketoacyl-ACP synthase III [Alphaproteobacteria bacterium]|nr:ketoacyl-ACP synthase III [Alphaproteobacteria bacterium]MBO4644649.1 ketoacyl-ACP synthase III [Alphaproteobacteria bacterium]
MVKAVFNNVKITAISTVVPEKSICLTDDPLLYDGNEKKIRRVIDSSGFLNRRVTESDVTSSDLCFEAAENLFRDTGMKRDDIDALLFVSYTPDYLMPATAYVLHKRLGLKNDCVVMDIPQACSGYVLGLYQSAMLLNGGCKKVLLLVGDAFGKFSDMFRNHTAPVFGDAGSASVVEYDETADPVYFNICSNGKDYDALMCKNGGFRNPPKPDMFYDDGTFKYEASMDGGRIFEFTIKEIAPHIKELFAFANIDKEKIDGFVFHQANKYIVQSIAQFLDIPVEKAPIGTLTEYGNQCGASIPCCLSDSFRADLQSKDMTLMLCGFGVGLSWASALIKTRKPYCSLLTNYKG